MIQLLTLSDANSVGVMTPCRSVTSFERDCTIGQGAYGYVFRAKDKVTGELVALKKVCREPLSLGVVRSAVIIDSRNLSDNILRISYLILNEPPCCLFVLVHRKDQFE